MGNDYIVSLYTFILYFIIREYYVTGFANIRPMWVIELSRLPEEIKS